MFNYKMVFVLMLINASQVNAVVLTGDVTGVFSEDSALIEWGVKKNLFSGSKSFLAYESNDSFSVAASAPFKIGALTYNNTEITETSSYAITVMDKSFDVGIALTNPSGSSYFFNFDITINETNNSEADSADKLTLIPADNFTPTFVFNGQEYVFELLGFDDGLGGFDNYFVQEENVSSSGDLYAKISIVPVPPAFWLFMTALTGFFLSSNRKWS